MSVRRLPNSDKWIADYSDQHKKRHQRQFPTKREAVDFLVDTGVEVKRGVHTPVYGSITVAEAAQSWLDQCRSEGLERSTLVNYEWTVKTHIVPTLGHVKLARLTLPRANQWRDDLVKDCPRSVAQRRNSFSCSESFTSTLRRTTSTWNMRFTSELLAK
jgi:hypothetical protein